MPLGERHMLSSQGSEEVPLQDGRWVQAPSKALTRLDWQGLLDEGEEKRVFANVNKKGGKKKCQGKEESKGLSCPALQGDFPGSVSCSPLRCFQCQDFPILVKTGSIFYFQ